MALGFGFVGNGIRIRNHNLTVHDIRATTSTPGSGTSARAATTTRRPGAGPLTEAGPGPSPLSACPVGPAEWTRTSQGP